MADNYLGFKYNGIHSFNDYGTTGYKAYIINEGEDLKFYNAPSFSNEFASPRFGETSYYLGNTKENRIIGFKVIVIEQTLSQYRSLLNWLNLDTIATLQFDYNEFFGYNVKVNSISEGNFTVNKDCDMSNPTYNVEFDIEFITVGDYAAQIITPQSFTINNGDSSGNFLDASIGSYNWVQATKILTITNKTNEEMFFNFNWVSGLITIKQTDSGGTPLYVVPSSTAKIYSKFGLILSTVNDSFVPSTTNVGRVLVLAKTSLADGSLVLYIDSAVSITFEPIIREVI